MVGFSQRNNESWVIYHEFNIQNVAVNTYVLHIEKKTTEQERDDRGLGFHKETLNSVLNAMNEKYKT